MNQCGKVAIFGPGFWVWGLCEHGSCTCLPESEFVPPPNGRVGLCQSLPECAVVLQGMVLSERSYAWFRGRCFITS